MKEELATDAAIAMRVEQVMHDNPETLTPHDRIQDAINIYERAHVNCVPILGSDSTVQGILTVFQVLEALQRGVSVDAPIGEVMDTDIVSVQHDTSFAVACGMPLERILVLNDTGGLVGVLTKKELIRKVYAAFDSSERKYIELQKILNCSTDGIMVLDSCGAPMYGNDTFLKHLPGFYTGAETVNGKLQRQVQELIKRAVAVQTVQTRFVYSELNKKYIITVSPFTGNDGCTRYVLTLLDVTEIDTLRREADIKQREVEILRTSYYENSGFVAHNPAMVRIFQEARQMGHVDSPVLISGETGVGKEVVAAYIHRHSERSKGPLIQINCGALPENLLDSELFGYEKGAFSGAERNGKIGLLEVADQGTLMLDEVGEMVPSLQVKLLRALQEGEIYRIGGRKATPINVRIIAMTNRNLRGMVEQRLFREDLYYRLNVMPIAVPPLRERIEDIAPLAQHFLGIFNKKYKSSYLLQPEHLKRLQNYCWPGNVRELANVMERLAILSGMEQGAEHIWEQLDGVRGGSITDHAGQAGQATSLREAMSVFEKSQISTALNTHASIRGAAKALGLPHSTLLRKARGYGISVQK